MKVKNARIVKVQGLSLLALDIDGQGTVLAGEQKTVARGYDLVFLGPEWADQLGPIVIPEDPATNRGEMTLLGFTDNAEVIALFRRYRELGKAGKLRVGPLR